MPAQVEISLRPSGHQNKIGVDYLREWLTRINDPKRGRQHEKRQCAVASIAVKKPCRMTRMGA
jgi:hypothetical protein